MSKNKLTKDEKKKIKERFKNSKKGSKLMPILNRLIIEGIICIISGIIILVISIINKLSWWYYFLVTTCILAGIIFIVAQIIIRKKEFAKVAKIIKK